MEITDKISTHRGRELVKSAIEDAMRTAEQKDATASELVQLVQKALVSCWTCGRYTSNPS
tara:strand:- start:9272 stop:9451 length:180 start_codon:yes stop_codon:yes gene_type:complete